MASPMGSRGNSRSAKMIAASTPSFSAAVMVTSAAMSGLLADLDQGVVFPDVPVLLHITAGLAQEPDWGAVNRLA